MAKSRFVISNSIIADALKLAARNFEMEIAAKPLRQNTISRLCHSVLGGLSIGFATPARVGEFAGRILLLPSSLRVDALYLSAVGGLAQSLVTFSVALVLLPFISAFAFSYLSVVTISFALLFFLVAIFLYFFFEKLTKIFGTQFPAVQKYVASETHLPLLEQKLKVLVLSSLRYAIYLFQYALLFRFVGVEENGLALAAAVALLLLLQSLSPLMPIADAALRGGFSLLIFHENNQQAALIFLVPFVLWLVNLLLPAILGYIFLLNYHDDSTG